MALLSKRSFKDAILYSGEGENETYVHVFEPEFHQSIYLDPQIKAKASAYGFFSPDTDVLQESIHRGIQPAYVDDLDDPESLAYIGMLDASGRRLTQQDTTNVAAIKSVCVRDGYVQLESARSVSEEFYEKKKKRAGIQKNDLLINSTGDGTIGRVAIYHYDYPALVDGHVSILRFKDPDLAWYAAAYLLTPSGQKQIYRYINGSSGQVEIYPNDLARLAIPKRKEELIKRSVENLKLACEAYTTFVTNISKVASDIELS